MSEAAERISISDANNVLIEQMRLACETARQLVEAGDYPKRELPRLRRVGGDLQLGYPDDAPDWQRFMPALTRVKGFWDRMTETAETEGRSGLRQRNLGAGLGEWHPACAPLQNLTSASHVGVGAGLRFA
jgi:hypothetical protein